MVLCRTGNILVIKCINKQENFPCFFLFFLFLSIFADIYDFYIDFCCCCWWVLLKQWKDIFRLKERKKRKRESIQKNNFLSVGGTLFHRKTWFLIQFCLLLLLFKWCEIKFCIFTKQHENITQNASPNIYSNKSSLFCILYYFFARHSQNEYLIGKIGKCMKIFRFSIFLSSFSLFFQRKHNKNGRKKENSIEFRGELFLFDFWCLSILLFFVVV